MTGSPETLRNRCATALLTLIPLLTPIAASAAANEMQADVPRFGEEIYVIGEIPFIEPVEPGQPVTVRFGIGQLEIVSTESNQIRADLDVRCRETLSEALCTKYRDRLRLEPRRGKQGVEVRLVGLSKWKLRKLELEGRVEIPKGSPLTVRVGIGEVDIRSDSEDLSVTMGIGDLTVRVPQENVGSVNVGTRIGDASLWRHEGIVTGKRRMLIGARVHWLEGAGTATIEVGLRIGDAKVVLE